MDKDRTPVVGIVQARMGSTRLPGKIALDVGAGQSLLHFVMTRLARSTMVDRWIVATSVDQGDDEVAQLLPEGIELARGSEEDVLQRYLDAAHDLPDEALIVRICSDNPFLDPIGVDETVRAHLEHPQADYVSYAFSDETPIILGSLGFWGESVRLGALRRWSREEDDLSVRQHVTYGIHRNPQDYNIHYLPLPKELDRKDLRFTIDTRSDYNRFRDILEAMGVSFAQGAGAREVLQFVKQYPDWVASMQVDIRENPKR